MHFAREQFLQLLWLLPLLGVFLFWSLRERRRRLERLVGAPLAPRLTREFSRPRAALRSLFILGFAAFTILALARPQWGTRLETVHRRGVDVIVALDTSYSMNAEDVAPSRLAVARAEIHGLIEKLRGDRVGLVSFAGMALVQCPLTLDYGAVALFLDAVNSEVVPEPGTSLAAAIEVSNQSFIARETRYKVLVLVTDGEDLEGQVDEAVRKARDAGVIIYTVGVGSPEGRPIPVRDDKNDIVEYRRDPAGQVVVSRLDERTLARIADATGGRYFRASGGRSELDELSDEISRQEKKELESRLYQNYEDRYQVPLAAAVMLLIAECWIAERRSIRGGWLARMAALPKRREDS